jgi:uncharacterized protein (DUF3820 family)
MPCGKYVNEPIAHVPSVYLEWYLEMRQPDANIKKEILKVLEQRNKKKS